MERDERGVLQALEERVKNLEAQGDQVLKNSDDIKTAMLIGHGVYGFFRKHGGYIVAFMIGAGYLNPTLGEFIRHFLNN